MKRKQIEGATRQDRLEMTARVRDAIVQCGGHVVAFQQYSNHMLSIQCESLEGRWGEFAAALRGTGLAWSRRAEEELDAGPAALVTIVLTFLHDEPDWKMPVPAVPG